MKRKEFAKHLLIKVLNVPEKDLRFEEGEYCKNVYLFSDKHADGTKVLRIKMYGNPTNMSLEECNHILTNYLADVVGIKSATVRKPYGGTDEKTYYVYSGLQFIIQVEYVGKLPDLKNPRLLEDLDNKVDSTKPTNNTTIARNVITGTFTIYTPFGIAYATSKTDLEEIIHSLENLAGDILDYLVDMRIDEFEEAIRDIMTEDPADWWDEAKEIIEEYQGTADNSQLTSIAMKCFKEVF